MKSPDADPPNPREVESDKLEDRQYLCRYCGKPKNRGSKHHPARKQPFCCFNAMYVWQAQIDISIKADKIEKLGGEREDAKP